LLILVESRLSPDRIAKELKLAERVIHPDVMRRLSLSLAKGRDPNNVPDEMGQDGVKWLRKLLSEQGRRAKPGHSYYQVLHVLLHEWLLSHGPVAIGQLKEKTGYSYPTISSALHRLSPYVHRTSDRKVELRQFPKTEWERLLAVSNEVRETRRYVDGARNARTPSAHLSRLLSLKPSHAAIGGVLGAKSCYPELDIVGLPRLDLSLHCPDRVTDLGFMTKLDPALRETKDPFVTPSVVVHIVTRKESFFRARPEGLLWADPVECLLDLYEARLDMQADGFLEALKSHRKDLTRP
jgi:hypothetical protein